MSSVIEKPKVRASLELSYSPIEKEQISQNISVVRNMLREYGASEIQSWRIEKKKNKSVMPDAVFEFVVPDENDLERIENQLKKKYNEILANLYMFVAE